MRKLSQFGWSGRLQSRTSCLCFVYAAGARHQNRFMKHCSRCCTKKWRSPLSCFYPWCFLPKHFGHSFVNSCRAALLISLISLFARVRVSVRAPGSLKEANSVFLSAHQLHLHSATSCIWARLGCCLSDLPPKNSLIASVSRVCSWIHSVCLCSWDERTTMLCFIKAAFWFQLNFPSCFTTI